MERQAALEAFRTGSSQDGGATEEVIRTLQHVGRKEPNKSGP